MALKISKETKSGVVATYLRIIEIRNKRVKNGSDFLNDKTDIRIGYWLNEDIRNLAKANGEQRSLEVDLFQTDEVFVDISSAYNYLKNLPEFTGAENC